MNHESKPFMNSYLAGFFLGLILLMTFFITGRGLGASGTIKSVVIAVVNKISPEHTSHQAFYTDYLADHSKPLKNWLVYLSLGVLAGAFFSGALAGRITLKLEKGPKISPTLRVIFAILGGILFGIGSQFGRGCTSGAALSGMAVLSAGGFLTMIVIFGTGYAMAYFFRKLWIH